jgi:hypothetical protein
VGVREDFDNIQIKTTRPLDLCKYSELPVPTIPLISLGPRNGFRG